MSSTAGDFQSVLTILNGYRAKYGEAGITWDKDFCSGAPYKFLSPFKFTFSFANVDYKNPANCSWPLNKTNFRIVLGVLQTILHIIMLFPRREILRTLCSSFGSPILLTCAFLWYSAFVLDCQSLQAATKACENHFETLIASTLGMANVDGFAINCNNNIYALEPLIDLVLFIHTFVMSRAWAQCPSKYGIPSATTSNPEAASTNADPSSSSAPTTATSSPSSPATASWWRASENAHLSEIFPRASDVSGTNTTTSPRPGSAFSSGFNIFRGASSSAPLSSDAAGGLLIAQPWPKCKVEA
jgi:hypothetical protein